MNSGMSLLFSKMIGTLAVVLVVSAFIGVSDFLTKYKTAKGKWKYSIIIGLLGGLFGVYGNISGFELNGAVVSIRDIGPMLAGFTGGPFGGIIAGLIAGLHRLTMGGITAQACVVATCCIGLAMGFLSMKFIKFLSKPYFAFLIAAVMEVFHLSVVLVMVKPFSTALEIVKQIAIPFILVNAFGFALMIMIMIYTERSRTLAIERNRMHSELSVANKIQHSLLPVINDQYPGRKDIDVSGFMEAAKEVGGDFYDLFFTDSNHLAFVIGDVSGKGVPAALFMASSKITLQNCIRDNAELSQAIVVANNALCANNEAEMFVTLWVGVLDLTTGEMNYVSAGHNPPVLLRKNKGEFLQFKPGFVLGGMEGVKYREYKMQLEKEDILYLYTDGVTEAEDEKHVLFGEDRLLACFENRSDNTSEEIIQNVKKSVDDFIDGNAQFDDMTMLCFKWK